MIAELQALRMRFVLVAKPSSHEALFTELAAREQRGECVHGRWEEGTGRSRWKIENEQFNLQKNHGYELEHNYGHGQQTLSMVFYLLNLLAFLAHKLLELGDRLYQQCCTGESRRGLWTLFRSAFYLLEFETWDALLRYHLRETVAGP